MSTQSNAVPVVIKRKKVVAGGGHHGGAWKVAYADFVTAMMAFFMLMWLLNATTEKQRKGIADYFSPTIPINRISGGGDGAFGGSSVFSQDSLAHDGTGGRRANATSEHKAKGDTGVEKDADADSAAFDRIREALEGRTGDSLSRETLLRHVATRVTDEGLIVEIFDREEARLFDPDTANPAPVLNELLGLVAEVFGMTRNSVAVNGHCAFSSWGAAAAPALSAATQAVVNRAGVTARATLSSRRRVMGNLQGGDANGQPVLYSMAINRAWTRRHPIGG